MHSRVFLTLFALLFMALAGCADDSDPTDDDTDDPDGADGGDDGADGSDGDSGSDDDGSDGGDSGSDGGDGNDTGENTAPTASLSASIEQGETPVNVTFTLDGSDADGDNVTWTFDADDDGSFEAEGDGTEFPASVNHSYAEEGLYNATLTISDGINSTFQVVTINATEAAAGGGTQLVIQGETSVPGNPTTSLLTGANGCIGFNLGEQGMDCVFGEIPADLAGSPFTFESTTSAPYYELWDACDPTGSVVQDFDSSESGTIPSGTGCVVMWTYSDGTGSFTFTVG